MQVNTQAHTSLNTLTIVEFSLFSKGHQFIIKITKLQFISGLTYNLSKKYLL